MAMSNDLSSIKVYIEAVQTVMPAVPTDPRISRQVLDEKSSKYSTVFRSRFHTILYYKGSSEDSGWLLAGWAKESLAVALSDQPVFAGRLRRVVKGGDGGLEIVPNDSGVRLIEARISMNLEEFLRLRDKGDAESQLVFWESIDEQDPQFSPLYYVQVTNFKCGGYSIGISCSLLLADPLVMISFLKEWACIHNKLVTKLETPKAPLFYLPNLGKATSTPPNQDHPSPTKNCDKTYIFKVTQKNVVKEYTELQNAVAMLCIEEANKREVDVKFSSKFYLITKEPLKDIMKVEICEKQEPLTLSYISEYECTATSWEDYLGADELSFSKGNKVAACVSYWINSPFNGERVVMIIQSPDKGISGIVTIPSGTSLLK